MKLTPLTKGYVDRFGEPPQSLYGEWITDWTWTPIGRDYAHHHLNRCLNAILTLRSEDDTLPL